MARKADGGQGMAKLPFNILGSIVDDVPQFKRGQVWCKRCGATQSVDSAECLRMGWPNCCNETMTIDSPEERR